MKTKTKVHGLKELAKAVNELTDPKNKKLALMRSGKKAMNQILADAITGAPMLSSENREKNKNLNAGELKGDITYRGSYNPFPKWNKSGRRKPLSEYEYVGQIRTGTKSQDYAVAVEYGRAEFTVMRITAFGRKVDPYEATMIALEPNPFMRKALDQNSVSAIERFKTELSVQIFNMAKRVKPKKKK